MEGVAVVIGTYNEAESIADVLDGLDGFDVILVDNWSPDGTGELAQEYCNVDVYRKAGLCLREAYMIGLTKALESGRYRYIVQMDAGLTHDPGQVRAMVEVADWHCADLVIGSRFLHGSRNWLKRNQARLGVRTAISLCASMLMRLLGVDLADASSGFRCWEAGALARVLEEYPIRAQGHAFQLEMVYAAYQCGLVVERPMAYRLTNSSFRPWMLAEAVLVYARLAATELRKRMGMGIKL